ncbi:hypothetical protein HHI36_006575 [Cryptolaemus montrouzieri]|uniref:Uncharacterized protein n=1 Tax=Cryptolaemus montrouzieri TaxID=559131 RepID=A0ABD2NYV8_9CUCU
MFLSQQILDVRANIGTDHKLVLAKLKMTTQLKKKTPSVKTEKFNVESLNNESTKQLYSNRCKQYITRNPILQQDNPDIAWLKLKENIYKGATEAWGTHTVSQNGKPNNKPWFTTEVKNITKEKKKIYL